MWNRNLSKAKTRFVVFIFEILKLKCDLAAITDSVNSQECYLS